jgi:uncharacterized damage-inducible protein DinB
MHVPSRIAARLLLCCAVAGTPAFALAQESAPAKPAVGTPQAPAQVYGKLLALMEKEFVSAAEAMPEDKFSFAPTQGDFKGVRPFGEQVKHVAIANAYFFHDPNKPTSDMKEKQESINKLTSKADIIQALKDSFAQAHTYVDAITPENAFVMTANGTRGGMASFGLAHLNDHYGQMVVYLRMNGIIPPASRPSNNKGD